MIYDALDKNLWPVSPVLTKKQKAEICRKVKILGIDAVKFTERITTRIFNQK